MIILIACWESADSPIAPPIRIRLNRGPCLKPVQTRSPETGRARSPGTTPTGERELAVSDALRGPLRHLEGFPKVGGAPTALSKFARVVDIYARRMQLQERMTSQVADVLVEVLEPQGLAVVTEASHLCMMMRGVEKQGSTTCINAVRGVFRDDARTRQEFLEAIR